MTIYIYTYFLNLRINIDTSKVKKDKPFNILIYRLKLKEFEKPWRLEQII